MGIFKDMDFYGHEQIVFGRDEKTGLKTIIAVHDTTLGPALGGTRFWNYECEEDAIYDVMRLSRGMSLKNAGAGLALGGGKAVIIGDPKKLKSKEFFQAYGRIVDRLNGCYYTAEDMNINTTDISHINSVTKYVTGTPDVSGNPSPFTARGVFMGMRAGVKSKLGQDDMKGLTVVVQGLGSVGYSLAQQLHADGAKLKVFDINQDAVNKAVSELGAVAIGADEILTTQCEVFAPCAMGAVINEKNAASLSCKVVCGSANNVLTDDAAGEAVEAKGVLYCPDYIVNAGGVINCGAEVLPGGYDVKVVNEKVDGIYQTTLNIIDLAKEKGIGTHKAADEYAMGIILAGRK